MCCRNYAPEVRFPGLRTAFPVALAEGFDEAFAAGFAAGFRLVPVLATVLAAVFFLAAGFLDATFTGLASPG
jgi:hypothetical protein